MDNLHSLLTSSPELSSDCEDEDSRLFRLRRGLHSLLEVSASFENENHPDTVNSEDYQVPESEDETSDEDEDEDNFDTSLLEINLYQNEGADNIRSHEEPLTEPEDDIEDENNNGISHEGTPAPVVDWIWTEVQQHNPTPNDFEDFTTGWTFNYNEETTEYECFQKCFPQEIIDECVLETNRFARSIINSKPNSRIMSKFQDIDSNEFLNFLAIKLIMGIDVKPQQNHYWSRVKLLRSETVPHIMSSDRYFEMLRYMHLNDNNTQEPGNRLQKISKIWDSAMINFKSLINPSKNLCIDESLVLFKGRLFFKQYVPNKRSRFGIKTFSLVDVDSGFIINSLIYSGKGHLFQYSTKDYGYGGAVTMELLEPYLNKNHVVYSDNWYSSPNLAYQLLQNGTYICSTARRNRKHLPKCDKMNKGEIKAFTCSQVLVQFWRDKKIVTTISTSHPHGMRSVATRNSAETKQKPLTVLDYNIYARGVDKADMMMSYYTILRKSTKWYKKLFFHLFDLCIYNAFRIYKSLKPSACFLSFRINLIFQILEYTAQQINGSNEQIASSHTNLRLSLPGKHHLEYNPATKAKKHSARKCRVCFGSKLHTKKRCETVYQCKLCRVPLCAIPCFELYHTKKVY